MCQNESMVSFSWIFREGRSLNRIFLLGKRASRFVMQEIVLLNRNSFRSIPLFSPFSVRSSILVYPQSEPCSPAILCTLSSPHISPLSLSPAFHNLHEGHYSKENKFPSPLFCCRSMALTCCAKFSKANYASLLFQVRE